MASELAVETVIRYTLAMAPAFLGTVTSSQEEIKENMVRALRKCESAVQTEAKDQAELRRMGTTVTMAYLLWPELFVVHVGDSRCYVLRAGELYQITTDHTVAQRMVENGALEPARAEESGFASILWQAIGGSERGIEPEVHQVGLEAGDTVLLCSDGLTGEVTDSEIRTILTAKGSAEGKCTKLIDAANKAGGLDNITVVVARAV